MHHNLKTHKKMFREVRANRKLFEFRKNDRDFHCGDTLVLEEYDSFYTGESEKRLVTFIVYGPDYGIPEGYCVMSLASTDRDRLIFERGFEMARTGKIESGECVGCGGWLEMEYDTVSEAYADFNKEK